MIYYLEPNFVEILLRESVFVFNLSGIVKYGGRKISNMVAILKRDTFFHFFADNHTLTYFIDGAIILSENSTGKWFSEGGGP